MSRRRVLAGLLAAALVALVAAVAVLAFAWHAVRSPDRRPLPDQADAVVVFAGEQARVDLARRLVDEGRSKVLVLSNGEASRATRPLCGQVEPFEVLCPTPDTLDTRGEARMFARLAQERGWSNLIAVTGDYHVARASLLLRRCLKHGSAFAAVPWPSVGWRPVLHEVGGLVEASTLDRSC
jgi:uncharacterized SAM-binding protein YcdF (DUF218 family)